MTATFNDTVTFLVKNEVKPTKKVTVIIRGIK